MDVEAGQIAPPRTESEAKDSAPPKQASSGAELAVRRVLAVVIGAGFSVGVLFFGYYDASTWSWIAVGFLLLAVMLVASVRRYPTGRAVAALLGLTGLWAWSLMSQEWAESSGRALLDANRWALYLAALGVLLLVVRRDDKVSSLLIVAFMVPWAIIVGWLSIRLLGGHTDLFLGPRLNKPLGYVNGQADYLALGAWPLIALAEDVRKPLQAGLAVFGASLLGCLLLLAQSRGSFLALIASAVVILALVPGRRKRFWVLVTVIGACGLAYSKLAPVWEHPLAAGQIDPARLESAMQTALVLSLVAGVVFGLICLAIASIDRLGSGAKQTTSIVGTVGVVLIVLLALGATVAASGRIRNTIDTQYHQFVDLKTSATGSRLTSGGGNRYDYWRVATDEFKQDPFAGKGAGNYPFGYFLGRRTTEDIHQPHSIELQTLSELGIVGGAFLLLFLGAVAVGLWRRARAGADYRRDRRLAVAAGGTFVVWIAHSSVDWTHLLPSLAGIALCCAAILLGTSRGQPRTKPVGNRVRWLIIGATGLVAALAALFVLGPALAGHERTQARALLTKDPIAALKKTNDALSYDDEDVETYYLRAAALARLNLYGDARQALQEAVSLEPDNWVTWGLLGDLAVRRGSIKKARLYYRRAQQLNPREPTLPPLIQNPRSAVPATAR